MAVKECVVCGMEFRPGPGQITCGPKCRAARGKDRRKAYKARIRAERPEEYRAKRREEKRRRRLRHLEATAEVRAEAARRAEREKAELAARNVRHCVVCGGHFPAKNNVKTCSDACWLERYRETKSRTARTLDPAKRKARKREYYYEYHAKRTAALRLVNEIKEKGIEALL